MTAVRSQARLLLDRMECQVGEGVAAADQRRAAAVAVDRRIRLERQRQATSLRQGQMVVRRGMFKLT